MRFCQITQFCCVKRGVSLPDSPRGCVESTPFAFCFPAEYRSLGIQITCICRDDSLLRCYICSGCFRRSGCCRMGIVAGGGQIICTVVAHGRAGAGTAGQQTALGAVAALHNASGTGECLIRQVCLHLFHQRLPRHNTGTGLCLLLAKGLGHIVGCVVAPPHSGDIIRRAAHEPQILFVAGRTGLTKGLHTVGVGVAPACGTHAGVSA